MKHGTAISRIASWFTWVAVAAIVIILPLGYGIISYGFIVGSLETEVEIDAHTISQLISRNPDMWTYEQLRLKELLSRRSAGYLVTRRIVDPKNAIIAEHSHDLTPPLIMRSFDLRDSGVIVGRIEDYRSLRPLLRHTAIAAFIGLCTGAAILLALHFLPLDAIRRAEKELQASEEKYRSLVESVEHSIYLVDRDGKYLFMNKNYLSRLGLSAMQYPGRTYAEFHSPEETKDFIERVGKVFQTGGPFRYEHRSRRGGRYLLEMLSPIKEQDGGITAANVISMDITERRQTEEALRQAYHELTISLKEKEVLMSEIHHRVKNNMQTIVSLLRLQSRYIEDKHITDLLAESQDRINSMALIHEKLYQTKDFTHLNYGDYIKDLTGILFMSYGTGRQIALKLDVDDVPLGMTTAIPVGLIINELVSNALKHAFPDGRDGEVGVMLKRAMVGSEQAEYELTVRDNGIGIPEGLDTRETKTLGLHLVTMLAEEQLYGRVELGRTEGTEFIIRFKGG
jgi:PAS domain S-box-containing protein